MAPCTLQPGQYEFPYEFVLPRGLPGTLHKVEEHARADVELGCAIDELQKQNFVLAGAYMDLKAENMELVAAYAELKAGMLEMEMRLQSQTFAAYVSFDSLTTAELITCSVVV